MTPVRCLRSIAALLAAACAIAIVAAQGEPRLRIASPTEDAYVTGPMRLVAIVEPPSLAREVTGVTFFVDGKQVCRIATAPFECEWDAGTRISMRQVRATAGLRDGRRLVATVTTREAEFVEAVDVDVLQITAVVTDGDGRFVRGLKQSDFVVTEDGKQQTLTHFASENIPLELIAAIDVSGSMREALPEVKESAKRFLGALGMRDQVTLLGFNDNIFTLARRSTDQAVRSRAIDLLASWGGTALYDVIIYAIDLLGRQSGRRSIVLFSDGDDQSSHATIDAAIRSVEGSDATIYAIGHGRAADSRALQRLLERITETSGGRTFVAGDPSKLDAIFSQIIDDLHNQYLLAYPTPTNARDGVWHRIKVEVPGRKYKVRARQGYRLQKRP